ncbi:MAG: gamma-glutamylcyclotransferase [Reyranella sp.]|nr:MAG: gamma-glutamylcyclotransferase [Reyranella sp.]
MADRLSMDTRWYFAYGSNMDAGRLAARKVDYAERIAGRLDGWQLAFDKIAREPAGAGAGNIVLRRGAAVHGTLNALLDEGFEILDRFEGVKDGHYERRIVPVVRTDTGATVEAITYVALKVGPGLRPKRDYLGHLLAGRDLLPAAYVGWLEKTPTFD